jgi:hypothetical protein
VIALIPRRLNAAIYSIFIDFCQDIFDTIYEKKGFQLKRANAIRPYNNNIIIVPMVGAHRVRPECPK